MRLFPLIDGLLNAEDGVIWPPFAARPGPGGDIVTMTLYINQSEEIDLER